MKYILITLLLATLSNKTEAQEVFIISSGGEDTYVITNSIRKINSNIIEVWLKIKLTDENIELNRSRRIEYRKSLNLPTLGYEKYSYLKVKRRYDCLNKKCTMIEGNTFTVDNKLLDHEEYKPDYWFSIIPETPSEKIFNYICK